MTTASLWHWRVVWRKVANWLRTTIVLTLLTVWALYIAVQLLRSDAIDPVVWGIPGGFLLLLGPSLKGKNGEQH